MGLGGVPARLDPSSLDMDRSLRDRVSRYAVERRDTAGNWTRIGLFGTGKDAAENVDLLVGMHGGPLSDYRITRVGLKTWIRVLGWVVLALLVGGAIAVWIAFAIG
jgi:hypothetical protein